MTFDEARDIILGVFKAAWDPTGFPAIWTDVPGSPPTNETVWSRITIRHATGNQASLAGADSTRRWNRTGMVYVQVFAPIGDGSKAGYNASQLVVNALQASRHSDIWFKDVRMNEVGVSGAFEQFNVLATFSYDDVR
jgi:Bacteriophage related domain of unknown function